MILIPLFLTHVAESFGPPGFFSSFPEDTGHPIIDVGVLLVENKEILGYGGGEGEGGCGRDIVSIESNSNRIIEGDDFTLAKLAPVFD